VSAEDEDACGVVPDGLTAAILQAFTA